MTVRYEVRGEVAAVFGYGRDDDLTDLLGQLRQPGPVELLQVRRGIDGFKNAQGFNHSFSIYFRRTVRAVRRFHGKPAAGRALCPV